MSVVRGRLGDQFKGLTMQLLLAMLESMESNPINIHSYEDQDWPQVWSVLEPVFRLGQTYAFPPDISEVEAHKAWVETPQQTYVAEENGQVVGTYTIKPNQPGQGAHVCNCGYVVATDMRGRGFAAQMCSHSLKEARSMGFKAMQYNLVVASNADAIHLWQKMGFEVVGRLPKAFKHPQLGYVEALVMYQWLGGNVPDEVGLNKYT
jgi:L-amino acid N-acyltransferase YncA